jgi:hypothetical protein
MENKIPNSDIIGYEGPVGQERAIHKTRFGVPEKTWRVGKARWVRIGIGRYKLLPKKRDNAGDEPEE